MILISINYKKIPKILKNVNFLIEIIYSIKFMIKYIYKYFHVNNRILSEK